MSKAVTTKPKKKRGPNQPGVTAQPKEKTFEQRRDDVVGRFDGAPEVGAMHDSATPKGKPQGTNLAVGNYAHNDLPGVLDHLRNSGSPEAASQLAELERIMNLPRGLTPNRTPITMSDGGRGIPDFIDRERGRVIELKPNTETEWSRRGAYQAQEYCDVLNKMNGGEGYLGRTDWAPVVLHYKARALKAQLRRWGYIPGKRRSPPKPTDMSPHKPIEAHKPTDMSPHKPVEAPKPTDMSPHKPIEAHKPADMSQHKPMEAHKPADMFPHKPIEAHKPADMSPHKPIEAHKPADISPQKSMEAHKLPAAPKGPGALRQALGAADKTMNVAGYVAAGGDAVQQLYERNYSGAAETAATTGIGLALGEAALPLNFAYQTYKGYDEETKQDANSVGSDVEKAIGEGSTRGRVAGAFVAADVAVNEAAYKGIKAPWAAQYTDDVKKRSTGAGEWVENSIGEGSTAGRVAGAITSSAEATGEVAFKGTFGVVGESIGGGLAAGYLWASGQRPADYEVPAYYQVFVENEGRLARAKTHLAQLTSAHPDSPAAAAAGQMLKQIAELETINFDYRQRKTATYWLSTRAMVLEQQAAVLR